MRRVLLAAACAAFLTTAAPAAASTLTLENGVVTYTGSAALSSDLAIAGGNASVVITRDASDTDPIATPSGCTDVNPTLFVCNGVTRVIVNAGDGNDTVDASTLTLPSTLDGGNGADTLDGGTLADSISGGAGTDTLTGNDGADTIDGGAGPDGIDGNAGADVLTGGVGADADSIDGGADNDTITGGDGDDFLRGGTGNDSVLGEAGDDTLWDDGGADVLSGGSGIDGADVSAAAPVSVTLDGQPNDGAAGQGLNVLPDVEDAFAESTNAGGAIAIVGNDGPNNLGASNGPATIAGGAGADLLYGGTFDDTIDARDGYPDRVDCSGGNDTALVDTLDLVSASCENVQVATVAGGADDHPPTIGWATPAAGASFSGSTTTLLTVTAADDRGLTKVQFYAGDRLLCEATAAPYTCTYQARANEVGRTALVAVATDGAGQATTAVRLVTVQPFAPSLSLSLKPSRDKKAPYKFKASGTLTKAGACSGTVTVTAKAGKKTVATKSAKVSSSCKYSASLTFKTRPSSKLKISAKFGGNSSTAAKSASSRNARLG